MMIICKECGAEISSLTKCCPRCGCPTKKIYSYGKLSVRYNFYGLRVRLVRK